MRHNEVWNIATALLTEVCHGVGIELHLQPITEEQLLFRTANREDGACLDIVAKNVWGRDRQRSFFDVRVFNPLTQTYHNTSLAQWNELEKQRAYNERVREIEHENFSPLVFSISGSMWPAATVVYKRLLASMIAEKSNKPYNKILHWMRCHLSYSLPSLLLCV